MLTQNISTADSRGWSQRTETHGGKLQRIGEMEICGKPSSFWLTVNQDRSWELFISVSLDDKPCIKEYDGQSWHDGSILPSDPDWRETHPELIAEVEKEWELIKAEYEQGRGDRGPSS